MKKLINQPTHYVEEMLAGLLLANPSLKLDGGSQRVIRRAGGAKAGKVGIASGGGNLLLNFGPDQFGEFRPEETAIAKGMEEKSREFREKGSELYQ
jgi:hypothetical protein